ncbi:kelch domain-containing protein [Podospora aff. communis PSN243]|uniref:Kelch domain-containing protein n=1 Tax=Podospora aff. communis PSN243 TaxID=3040156 RepID=A0AAV9G4Q7_9PEZI|nr:kelch domain-containing protein [Podospora aff. communis PSN243]
MKLLPLLTLIPSALTLSLPPGGHRHPKRQLGTWSTLAPIPLFPRQEHTTVALSSTSLAILGGIIPTTSGGANTTSLVQLYDIPTNTWKTLAPLPTPLNHLNAATIDGKIYVLGGLELSANNTWTATPKSWVYDPATNKWTDIAPMPASEARGSAAVGVYNKQIFLAGGMNVLEPFAGGRQGTVDVVSAFDTASGKWLSLPETAKKLPEGRDHAGAAVVDLRLYVLGGRDKGQGNVKGSVFALSLGRLDVGWRTMKGVMPTPRGGVAAAKLGRKVYVMGGEGNPAEGSKGVFGEVEVFDPVKDAWESAGKMSVPRHGTYAVPVEGKIYVPGGGTQQGAGAVDLLDVFVPAA